MKSTSSTPVMGRPAESTRRIVLDLRGRIVTGRLAPGEQLPTRVQIEQEFGAGKATVQRALEQLRKDGFVDVNGKLGTFVAEHPPHLARYAIAFPKHPHHKAWNLFWTGLCRQVIELERSQESESALKLPIYFGIDGASSSPDYARLLEDVMAHRVAGIIFMSDTFSLEGTPLMEEAGVPRVAVAGRSDARIPLVTLDHEEFQRRSLQYLAGQGRRKVAVLGPPMPAYNEALWKANATEAGVEIKPFWMQSASQIYPEAARNITHLMFQPGQSVRPDGLIISDDNLLDLSMEGLLLAGVGPGEVEVVAHCNFPVTSRPGYPVRYLGYDGRQVITACIETIDRQRRGLPTPGHTNLKPLFAHEVPQTWHLGQRSTITLTGVSS